MLLSFVLHWCRHRLKGAVTNYRAPLDTTMVVKAVMDVLPSLSADKYCIVLDVCAMEEPVGADTRMHSGLHPAILWEYCSGTAFDHALSTAFHGIKRGSQQGARDFVFIVVDKCGQWASKALGKILAEVALFDKFLTLNKVTVLTPDLDFSCHDCMRCRFWDRSWADKNAAVAACLTKWRRLVASGQL